MFITFTFRCPECGHEEDRLVLKSEIDAQRCGQRVDDPNLFGAYLTCRARLIRLPAATRTTFRFADTRLKD